METNKQMFIFFNVLRFKVTVFAIHRILENDSDARVAKKRIVQEGGKI
jgi:hypothetical protein